MAGRSEPWVGVLSRWSRCFCGAGDHAQRSATRLGSWISQALSLTEAWRGARHDRSWIVRSGKVEIHDALVHPRNLKCRARR